MMVKRKKSNEVENNLPLIDIKVKRRAKIMRIMFSKYAQILLSLALNLGERKEMALEVLRARKPKRVILICYFTIWPLKPDLIVFFSSFSNLIFVFSHSLSPCIISIFFTIGLLLSGF